MDIGWIPLPGWLDLVDIALVAAFGWLAIRYLRRTRARQALIGLAVLGLIYAFARAVELQLVAALFQGFFAVLVLVLIVVFQEDLRRLFERLGSWRTALAPDPGQTRSIDVLVRTVSQLAASRTGALVVIPGREPLDRHLEGGIALGGRISEPLLLSLFDSSSPGHDGAVVIRGDSVERFAAHLPLSANHEALGPGGTRHAAGLGLAERCDALSIIVSEERGTISVARDGSIRVLARAEDLIEEMRPTSPPEAEADPWWSGSTVRDAAVATVAAIFLWMALVPGSTVQEVQRQLPIEIENLPDALALESVEPTHLEVTLRGLQRSLLLMDPEDVPVRVDAYLARFGRRTFKIAVQDIDTPDALEVVAIEPETIKISLVPAKPGPPQP
jgi:uncharacterized protein (TIGR00159 family)